MTFIAYSGTVDTSTTPGSFQGDQQSSLSSLRDADGGVATSPTPIVSDGPAYTKIAVGDSAPDHSVSPVWLDTSGAANALKVWDGSAWKTATIS